MTVKRAELRRALLAGTAILPFLAAGAAAEMVDPFKTPMGFAVFVEGRYVLSQSAQQPWSYDRDTGALYGTNVKQGWSGSVGARFQFVPNWDVGLSYTGVRNSARHDAAVGNGCVLEPVMGQNVDCYNDGAFKISQRMDFADFDVGYRMMLGSRTQLRASAGLRLTFWDMKASSVHTPYDTNNERKKASYWGIGPRIGVESTTVLFEAGPGFFTLQGSLAGSVLFGRSHNRVDSLYDDNISMSDSTSKTKAVPNGDASIGIGYIFPIGSARATVLFGYRGEAWWRLVDTRTASPPYSSTPSVGRPLGSRNGNLYQHGPFGRLTVAF